MLEAIEKLREVVTRGGGLATPFVTLSRTAEVEKGCEVSGNAEILGRARVLQESVVRAHAKLLDNAEALKSVVQGHARIGGFAVVRDSVVDDTADIRGDAFVGASYVGGNALIDGRVSVYGSKLSGNIRVLDNAKLDNVSFHHSDSSTAIIEGDAELRFPVLLPLFPGTRVDTGLWKRPPFVVQCSVFAVCEDVEDKVKVGCLSHTVDFWYKHGRLVLIKYGLPEALYEEYLVAVRMVDEFKKTNPSPKGIK